jgi:hypothetical protein
MPTSTYTPAKSEFLTNVVNKIGKQIYSSTAYQNPLKRLKKGFIDNANDIEEIYIARAVGYAYDAAATDTLARVKPTVTTQYHTENFDKGYTVTVQDKQVRQAFQNTEGVNRLANEIITSLHTGSEYDEYVQTLAVLNSVATNAPSTAKKTITAVTDNATAKALVKQIKKDVKAMGDRSATFATVENHCKPSDLILFLNRDYSVEIDVELLATAFNIDKAQLSDMTIIEIPALTDTKIKAIVADNRAIQIYDTYYEVEPQRNAKGKFTNQHLTVSKIFSYSNLVNVAVYSTAT